MIPVTVIPYVAAQQGPKLVVRGTQSHVDEEKEDSN